MNVLLIKWNKRGKPEEAVFTDFHKTYNRIVLWKSGSSLTILQVLNAEEELKGIVNNSDCLTIINYKKYCDYFGFANSQDLYDYQADDSDFKSLIRLVNKRKDEIGFKWQQIRADASEVYCKIENRGIIVNGIKKYPKYHMDVSSGRSSTTGFNVQGSNSDWDISHPNPELNMMVRFDWIAADMKIASYLSDDDILGSSYDDSDPYSYVVDILNGEIDRSKCKLALNKAVNALYENDLIFKIFPKLGSWMVNQKSNLESGGYVETILGRRFYTDGSMKGNRRAINGTLQGSIAHAMQSVISSINDKCGDVIITDQHDSLTIATSSARLLKTINICSKIMLNPFDDHIRMPVVVEVGKSWGKYKKYKEFR